MGGAREPVCPGCRTRLAPLPGLSCPRCQHPRGPEGAPCALCDGWPDPLVGARSVTRFDGVAARLVQELKYGGWTRIAPVLARPMARMVRRVRCTDPVLVPVPTTPRRLRSRGFNAPELLAEEVGRILEIPVEHALSRPREAPRQVGLSPSQRAANVRGAFIAGPASNAVLRHHHVFLVDDVLTTGSTGVAAAEALAAVGVRSVTLLTFARALPGLPGT